MQSCLKDTELQFYEMTKVWGITCRTMQMYLTILKVKVTQLCLTLCDPVGNTVHGILQARILE